MTEPQSTRDVPRQRRGTTPQMRGRYPEYDCLEQAEHWDPQTRKVVTDRIEHPPSFAFFTESEVRTLTAFCDIVLAQDSEPRVPVLAFVDRKLAAGKLDGFQYADMPDDRETWRLVARGLDEAAREHAADSYAKLEWSVQETVADQFAEGNLNGRIWDEVDQTRAWSVLLRSILAAFYSHPWAWNEIGFGGPAYPRGYARLGGGLRESWEGEEAAAQEESEFE
jgi:Gluconate 2-dehydrogenase subunit 3